MKNNIYLSILLIFSVSFSTIIWNFIAINSENIQILGEYSKNKHHALNDPLRYAFFILFPVSVFFLFKFFFEKKKFSFENIKFNDAENENIIKDLFVLNLVIIFFLLLEFFSLEFPTNKLDIYHEGQKLSAPFKALLDNKLWSGSYVTTGIINESLGISLIWKILGHQSIGSMRFLQILYILFLKLSLVLMIYFIAKNIALKQKLRLTFYLLSSFLTLFLIDYNVSSSDAFSYRDLPIILCLIFFFKSLNIQNNINFSLISISLLSVLSFLWSVDRAINVNFLLIFIFLFLLINNQKKKMITILISFLTFWLLFYFYFADEFKFFLENTFNVLKNQNYIHGIIHPQPFSDMPNATRATKSLLLIILSLLISLGFFFHNQTRYNNKFKIILITLSLAAFCSYLYALGRSDGGHIKQTTGVLILFFSIFIFFNFLKLFEKVYKSNFSIFIIFSLVIIFILNLKIDVKKIYNYSERLNKFVTLEDKEFLSEDQNYLVNNIKPFLNDYNCIQLFTNDAALPYLFKKPNCSKYYFIYSLGSVEDQNKLVKYMKSTDVVVYTGQTDNWGISPQKKLTIVNNYINSEFLKTKKILEWELKFR